MSFKKNNKGFTIIEVALVLLVVGVLIGLSLKGTSLFEATRIKADVNKFNKITAGISAYYNLYQRLPGKAPKEIYDNLIKSNILRESDFKLISLNKYIGLIACDESAALNNGWIPLTRNNRYLCAYISDNLTYENQMRASTDVFVKFYCYLETAYDDKNWIRGEGRITGGEEQWAVEIPDWDCGRAPAEKLKPAYLFRVF